MDTDNNDIKHYSAEDITRYWEGKLSPQEMHAMEKAAMDDPFLADAMEGYSTARGETVAAGVRELRDRLKQRTGDTTIVPFRKYTSWWRVAAAVILLCGAGALTYTLFLRTGAESNKITKVSNTQPPAAAPVITGSTKDTLTVQSANDSAGGLKDANMLAGEQNNPAGTKTATDQQAPRETEFAAIDRNKKNNEDIPAFKQPDTLSVAFLNQIKEGSRKDSLFIVQGDAGRNTGNPARDLEALQRNNPNNRANAPVIYRQMENPVTINNFSGRVVDRNNAPIPFASVRVNNNTQLAAADQDGNFQLRSLDSVLNLSVASVGYETRQLTLRGNQPQDVMLEPSGKKMEKNLDEVVVSGYDNKKKKAVTSNSSLKVYVIDAEPVTGWDEYNNYIEKNKRVDSTASRVKGEVVLSFIVGKTGNLSNFNIEKSLGKQQDAEAIRLIKEGPAWKVLKSRKTKARIIIPF